MARKSLKLCYLSLKLNSLKPLLQYILLIFKCTGKRSLKASIIAGTNDSTKLTQSPTHHKILI